MKESIGVCLGASTISIVRVAQQNNEINILDHESLPHHGNPQQILSELLRNNNKSNLPVVVTGRKFRKTTVLTNISEPVATEIAFSHYALNHKEFSAIASLGGETFMVYTIDDDGRISSVITRNQCASGTGEFFMQQIKRMGLDLKQSKEISRDVKPFKVSGRCSVFCKSDCTHALNKGTPKSEVTSGLALMIAEKVEELVKNNADGKILLIGGVTKNDVVMDFVRQKFPDAVVPKEATYFEALGAAIYGIDNEAKNIGNIDIIFNKSKSSFSFFDKLEKYKHLVEFKEFDKSTIEADDKCILGLDVGSTTTKAVLINSKNQIIASVYIYTNGNPVEASKKCYADLLEQIGEDIKIRGVGVTGSGRQIAGLHALTDGVINEIIAHATAAVHFDEEVDTIFEIGGQDAKYTYIINRVPADYAMNEACSAGTGSFIEEAAYESLRIKVTDIEQIAMEADNPPNFNDQCAAFIGSDIKTAQQENIPRKDIVAGLVYSICQNYVNRVKGNRPVGKKIFMQGGVCYNKAIPIAMAALVGKKIIVPPEPGLMGAFGVALSVKEKLDLGLMEEKDFRLSQLSSREVKYHKPFICMGGKEKCDRRCEINMIEVLGQKYPFGGACNKYYNLRYNRKVDTDKFDLVKMRNKLMREDFVSHKEVEQSAKTVGINNSFNTHTMLPLYHNFFTELGFKVVLSDNVDEEGLDREMTAFCYPGQQALCLFQDLLKKNTDYIFVPSIFENYVEDKDYHRLDFNCSCVFVSGESYFLKQAFKDYDLDSRYISKYLNFAYGWDSQEEEFIDIARQMGIDDEEKARYAYQIAAQKQNDFQDALYRIGEEFLKWLADNPEEFAITLVGRPYNTFAEIANKSIPQKIASRGIHVVPYDMFDFRDETVDDNQYWESGLKILKSAKIVKRHPQLFAVYVSNFSCGPDSMIINTFRGIMGSKPSLTLELDGHTADAGINTRIDAAIDIIKNYRKISEGIKDPDYSHFRPSKVELGQEESYFVDSDGNRLPLDSPDVEILIPSMGDLAATMFAAAFRSLGFNAKALPQADSNVLKYGRSVASGKECLPLLILAGSLINYLENEWDGKKRVAFFTVQGAGNCRLGQYPVFLRDMIKRRNYRNVAQVVLMNEDGFAGFGSDFAMRGIQAIIISDVMDDIRSAVMANSSNPDKSLDIFYREFNKVVDVMATDPKHIYDSLDIFADNLNHNAPASRSIEDSKYIAMLGEIFVRRDGFSHKWLNEHFAKEGFIIKDAYISEWILYVDYLLKIGLLEPEKSLKKKVEREIRHFFMVDAEKKIKRRLAKSGYYEYSRTLIEPLLKSSKHILPWEYKGEPGLTVGVLLHETLEKYCGVINIGPFGCMPTRFSEAIGLPESKVKNKIEAERINNPTYELPDVFNGNMNIPFLTIETDGNAYPQVVEARIETFIMQANRIDKLMKKAKSTKKNGNIFTNIYSQFQKIKKV